MRTGSQRTSPRSAGRVLSFPLHQGAGGAGSIIVGWIMTENAAERAERTTEQVTEAFIRELLWRTVRDAASEPARLPDAHAAHAASHG